MLLKLIDNNPLFHNIFYVWRYCTTRNLVICNQSLCNLHAIHCRLQLQIWYCIVFGPYNYVQLNVYNMDTCHKNNGLNLYIFKLLYLIYLHRLYIIVFCTFNTKVNPILT